ncbi:MAG: hypothetical protein KC493_08805 [Bacteriovoracaceae bacterium]|nr:hypothetical protein [Bacteriovoracaceae bacterium]
MKNLFTVTCNKLFLIRHYTIICALVIPVGLYSTDSYARLSNYETTRLKSTAGAGVGSVLMDEASILNPAGIAFYTMSSIYFQKGDMSVTPDDYRQSYIGNEPTSFGIIASDASKGTGGSVSLTKQQVGYEKRKRISAALASPVTKKSSIGATIRKTTDTVSPSGRGGDLYEEKYVQGIFGITHGVSDSFTLGIVAIDPLKNVPEDTRGIIGFQYTFEQIISIMADLGADYSTDPSSTMQWKGAVQVKAYNDFFIRFGAFNDKAISERGNGAGIGWVGPKLVVEFAYKNTNIEERPETNQEGSSIKETSFSLAYKF